MLLAGGRSLRLGTDKALLVVDGERLVDRAARVLSACCAHVVLASGARPLPGLGLEIIADLELHGGPLGAIVPALETASTQLVAVLAVDHLQPSADVFRALADAWSGEAAVVPLADGRRQVLHAVYATAAAPALRAAWERGERSITRALGDLDVRELSGLDASFARDLDQTRSDGSDDEWSALQ